MEKKAKELEQSESIVETENKKTPVWITGFPEVETLKAKKMVIKCVINEHFYEIKNKSESEDQNYTSTSGTFYTEKLASKIYEVNY